ncbi:MAG: family 20 glycosylhydrolase [Kiritimatiellae bacterium]|nr:family 20 glycosylhydrolase [Kiritimatiellia bacterium]
MTAYHTTADDMALAASLEVLSRRYPQLAGKKGKGTELRFTRDAPPGQCSARREGKSVVISYDKPNMALRMAGSVISGTVPKKAENCPFDTIGIMLDCSRNSVKTVDYLKGYFDRLAILGYNMVMLYTEETYKIDGEPFFGFMRGAYTHAEIRELDDYAASLGIELIPCIQALAHLEQIFKWGKYKDIRDLDGILLEGEEKTYELVEKMVETWSSCVRSRRIHLGMDEAHGLGTGEHERRFGRQSGFEIINRHLKRCCAICEKYGMKPMIWSDMYFRIGSKTNAYYDLGSQPPEKVAKGIPKGLELVYWDYYHDDQSFYEKFIDKHRALSGDPLMGSGVWTWNLFWYSHHNTRKTVEPCLKACRAKKLREVFFTMWGDQGGYCDYGSALAGLAYSAELAFTGEAPAAALEKRLKALCGGSSYKAVTALGEVSHLHADHILLDDPLMLLYIHSMKATRRFNDMGGVDKDSGSRTATFEGARAAFEKARRAIASAPDGEAGSMALARAYAEALCLKMKLASQVFAMAGRKDHRKAAAALLDTAVDYEEAVSQFYSEFHQMWHSQNKPFGLESIQIRLGGQVIRAGELVMRLEAFLAGDEKTIPEFAELATIGDAQVTGSHAGYLQYATASCIF